MRLVVGSRSLRSSLDWAMAYRVNAGLGDIARLWAHPRLTAGPVHAATEGEYGQVRFRRMAPGSHRRHPKLGVRASAGVGWPPYPAINKIAPALEARIAARWQEYGIGIPYLDDERRELLTMEQLSKRLPDV